MIEPRQQPAKRRLDLEEIHHETGGCIDIALQLQLRPIGVAVHAVAAMGRWHVRQPMRGFEPESLCDLHGRPGDGRPSERAPRRRGP